MTIQNPIILFVCHEAAQYGAQQSLKLLVEELNSTPFRAVVSFARSGSLEADLIKLPHVAITRHDRLQWIKHDPRNPFQKMGDILGLLWNIPGRVSKLARIIQTHQVSVVHTNSLVSLEGALAAKVAGVPHIWHVREFFNDDNPKVQPILGIWLTRWIIQRLSHKVLLNSHAVARQFLPDDLEKYPEKYPEKQPEKKPGRYQVIHNPVNPLPYPPKTINPKGFHMLYLGRLTAGKRIHDLLAALDCWLKQAPPVKPLKLTLVGHFVDTPYETRIQQAASTLQQAHPYLTIHFAGFQSNPHPFLAEADVLILPSANEAFGRVLIEALQAGVRCIATESGGVPDILRHPQLNLQLGEDAWLYPPGDTQALARCFMEAAAKNMPLNPEVAHRVTQVFSLERHIQEVTGCYQELLK